MNAIVEPLLTGEDLLAMPEDGMERWLFRGVLRERPGSYRDRVHAHVVTCVAVAIHTWIDHQPEPRGWVGAGAVGCRLYRNPDTVFGVDVLYISPSVVARQPDTQLIEGAPTLAVEVFSLSDPPEEVQNKIDLYLTAGTSILWLIHCLNRTVTVLRPGPKAEEFGIDEELSGEPSMPGFYLKVRDLFDGAF